MRQDVWVEPLTFADCYPFETVTLVYIRDDEGEPTGDVEIGGLRQGGMRSLVVPYARLLEHADTHLEFNHGKAQGDPVSPRELAHARTRAAVAFLID